eukprot:366391-Chlamydomonas_euryale.AAC.45
MGGRVQGRGCWACGWMERVSGQGARPTAAPPLWSSAAAGSPPPFPALNLETLPPSPLSQHAHHRDRSPRRVAQPSLLPHFQVPFPPRPPPASTLSASTLGAAAAALRRAHTGLWSLAATSPRVYVRCVSGPPRVNSMRSHHAGARSFCSSGTPPPPPPPPRPPLVFAASVAAPPAMSSVPRPPPLPSLPRKRISPSSHPCTRHRGHTAQSGPWSLWCGHGSPQIHQLQLCPADCNPAANVSATATA